MRVILSRVIVIRSSFFKGERYLAPSNKAKFFNLLHMERKGDMMNLKEMTVAEAVRTAKEISGKTGKEIADALGISRGVITRYLKEDDDYSPRMGMIPDLCDAFENDILLQWLEVRIREGWRDRRQKMLLHVGKMKKALEEVTLLLATVEEMAVEDEEELYDLINKVKRECQRMDFLLPRARYQDTSGARGPRR